MSVLSQSVKRMILKAYDETSTDIKQIIEICDLVDHKIQEESPDITILSPEFTNDVKQYANNSDLLECPQFCKKYQYFISLLYGLLKLKVPVFDEKGQHPVMLNNQKLLKSIERTKRDLIKTHILILNSEHKNAKTCFSPDYEEYSKEFITKTRQLDRIRSTIDKLLKQKVWLPNETLLSLITPYFYSYIKIVEVFGD